VAGRCQNPVNRAFRARRSRGEGEGLGSWLVPFDLPAFLLQGVPCGRGGGSGHRSLCKVAGYQGPLHECSIYGSEEAGPRLAAMLEKGRSQPWQDTLEELTGGRETDASAIIDYFAPLMTWLV